MISIAYSCVDLSKAAIQVWRFCTQILVIITKKRLAMYSGGNGPVLEQLVLIFSLSHEQLLRAESIYIANVSLWAVSFIEDAIWYSVP